MILVLLSRIFENEDDIFIICRNVWKSSTSQEDKFLTKYYIKNTCIIFFTPISIFYEHSF